MSEAIPMTIPRIFHQISRITRPLFRLAFGRNHHGNEDFHGHD
jgi:hypothetical protein